MLLTPCFAGEASRRSTNKVRNLDSTPPRMARSGPPATLVRATGEMVN